MHIVCSLMISGTWSIISTLEARSKNIHLLPLGNDISQGSSSSLQLGILCILRQTVAHTIIIPMAPPLTRPSLRSGSLGQLRTGKMTLLDFSLHNFR